MFAIIGGSPWACRTIVEVPASKLKFLAFTIQLSAIFLVVTILAAPKIRFLGIVSIAAKLLKYLIVSAG